MELTGREVRALVDALAPAVGGKIQKVYGTERFALVLDLYARELDYRYLYVELPNRLFMHSTKVEMPDRPPGFAHRVRHQLQGLRIVALEQHGCDRIMIIRLEGARRFSLVIELFAKGNLAVLDDEGVIRNVLIKESYGSRDVRPGARYSFPPSAPISFDDLGASLDPDKHLVAQLAAAGFGGHTAQAILSRFVSDVASARLADLADVDGLRDALRDAWYADRFSLEGERIVADPGGVGILELFASHIELASAPAVRSAPPKRKSERAIEIQSKRAESLAERREHDLRRGEVLFEQYALVDEVLSFAREYREEHGSLEGIETHWPERFPPIVSTSGVVITLDFESFI